MSDSSLPPKAVDKASADPPPIDLASRLQFLRLTSDDGDRLRSLLPLFRDTADQFVEKFYDHLLSFGDTARFLQDPQLVARLKQAQRNHLESMLEARWSDAYVHQRLHVGDTHANVGLEPQFFLGAYNEYVQHCFRDIAAVHPGVDARFLEPILSLLKAIFLDIGLTLDAYFLQSTLALRSALDMVWQMNSELRQFAELTSHDLKTPLATVANLCDETLDEFGGQMPAEATELIRAARQRTYRMSAMIDELLAVSTSTEPSELNEEIAHCEFLQEAIEGVRPLLEEKRIKLSVSDPLPSVWGNRVRLREAFYNLLSNAAKFMDKESGEVKVDVRVDEDICLFIVADNGPGIPPEELERIFSPFRRLPKHRDVPGSGLGLYFTKSLVEQHGGRVWAESEVGAGSRFLVQLKRCP